MRKIIHTNVQLSALFVLPQLAKLGFLAVCALLLSYCATTPRDTTGPEDTYQEGVRLTEVGNYLDARQKLEFVKNKFPYSQMATEAELALADLSFKEGNYIQAATEYEIFFELHPKHPKADYVLFKNAQCYYEQIPYFIGRDQVSTEKALRLYQKLLELFPKSTYIEDGHKRIEALFETLVQKELHIAEFYERVDLIKPAAIRYEHIVKTYPQYAKIEQILKKTISLSEKAGLLDQAQSAREQLQKIRPE